ncbi:MAG: hypothetical protein LBF95_04730, partial [Treponema sp.]|nr:hypothetical protein [Treponema sp.]
MNADYRRRLVRRLMPLLIGIGVLGSLYAQAPGGTRFVNNTPFVVHIVAGSGRTDVCTLEPRGAGVGRGGFGLAEYYYPVFDVPLTGTFHLRNLRPADVNFFYQIDDRVSSTGIVIDAAPPLNESASYIVLVNNSRTGGVSIARTASSRLSRIDGGSDNVNAGESGVFRVNPRDTNDMRIVSPVNIAFAPVVYRPAFVYVFAFDGTDITLVDARPLHTIGLPVDALVVFDGTIPEAEQDTLRGALDEALAAHKAPLRIAPADREAGEDVRYEFTLTLTMVDQKASPLTRTVLFSGELTLALCR